MSQNILPVSITQETRDRYLRYAMSVILSRALPDVRDGLKPVQRRILYVMHHDLRLNFDGPTRKCAKIVGDVTGNYHPHGDVAVYEALVRLGQNWVMREPLIHKQGNFGSVDGDPPAAQRYTEAKLSAIASRLMDELAQDTVDMQPNYDNTRQEPKVLPAQFPNLLVNGSSGIAVGLATNIPPHNLGEVLKACVLLIDHPEATTAELMQKVKGPDFPLGGKIITDRATLRQIYEEGTGSIKIQGEWKLEEDGSRRQIVITSIPYGVDKGKLEAEMGAIIEDKKLPQVTGLSNESNEKDGLRIVLDLKRGADPALVMAYFYKHTDLQQSFAYNLTCLVPTPDGRMLPQRLGLKAILRHFLDFRLQTVRRRFQYELNQLKRRIHILEGFQKVFDALDEAIHIIRTSSGKADAAAKLMARFQLDGEQTSAILEAQLYKIAQLEIQKILDELKEKRQEAERIESILASEAKLWGVIKQELTELAEQYGNKRRTRMANEEDVPEYDPEAYIVRENTNVVVTRDGWIKRVGRLASVEGTRVREGDEVIAVVPGNTVDHVIFFTDDGTAYTMRIQDVPASSGYGEPITKYFKLNDNVRVIAAETTDERFTPADRAAVGEVPGGPYLLAVSSQGYALRTPMAAFRTASTRAGRRFMRLGNEDKVVFVQVVREESAIFLASEKGRVVLFPIDEVSILSGAGKGVVGMKLDPQDRCIGGLLTARNSDKLVLETSSGKTLELTRQGQPLVHRGSKGLDVVRRSTLTRIVPPPIELIDWENLDVILALRAQRAASAESLDIPTVPDEPADGLFHESKSN